MVGVYWSVILILVKKIQIRRLCDFMRIIVFVLSAIRSRWIINIPKSSSEYFDSEHNASENFKNLNNKQILDISLKYQKKITKVQSERLHGW